VPEDKRVVEISSSPSPSSLPATGLHTPSLELEPAIVAVSVPDPVLEPGPEPDPEPRTEPDVGHAVSRKRKIKMGARKSSRPVKEEGGWSPKASWQPRIDMFQRLSVLKRPTTISSLLLGQMSNKSIRRTTTRECLVLSTHFAYAADHSIGQCAKSIKGST